jgi:hypothetical protein
MFTTTFNTTEITSLNNGGGVKVKMLPTKDALQTGKLGTIELHLTEEQGEAFTHGHYKVTFEKVD